MVPPIITPPRSRRVSDNRAGHGADQTARNRSAGRLANQAADKCASAATDQSAAQHAVVPSVRTTKERQRHRNGDECLAHRLPPFELVTKHAVETRCFPAYQPPEYRRLRSIAIRSRHPDLYGQNNLVGHGAAAIQYRWQRAEVRFKRCGNQVTCR